MDTETTSRCPTPEQPDDATRQSSTNAGSTRYQYATDLSELNSRADGQSDHIRLIRTIVYLNNHVSCTLVVFSLSAAPLYGALSYSWSAGDQSSVTLTIVERSNNDDTAESSDHSGPRNKSTRGSMTITRDLQSALRRLQLHNVDFGWLWIDAICVDQANTTEKSDQVNIMRSIYQEAEVVYVWLGEETEADDPADEAIIVHKVDLLRLLMLEERAWWFRLWVIQELALAHDVVVCLGSRAHGWLEFAKFVTKDLVEEEPPYILEASATKTAGELMMAVRNIGIRITMLAQTRRSINGGRDFLSLRELLDLSIDAHATEPVDMIIGLLGLTSRATRAHVQPTYGSRPAVVFATVCLKLIEQTKSLDILVGPWPRIRSTTQDVSVPSWVVNFAAGSRTLDEDLYGSASTPRTSSSSLPRFLCMDGRVLHLVGLLVDQVSIVQCTEPLDADALHGTDEVWKHLAGIVSPFISDTTTTSQRRNFWCTLPTKFVDLDRDDFAPAPTGKAERRARSYTRGSHQASSQTWEGDFGNFIERILCWRSILGGPPTPRFEGRFKLLGTYWLNDVVRRLRHQVLFRTSRGYIGITSAGVQTGDIAIVPFGASVPFLLRQVPDCSQKRYELVSGCLIQGIMHGELMDAYEADRVQERWYTII
ncbi:hypothetical protein LTR17_013999 [Elasticomyces elasticus]|nr:hypothetical protein LTR17_013999 [Elasticomyces elasticus]